MLIENLLQEKKDKKTEIMTIRLTKKDFDLVDDFCKNKKIKRSDLFKLILDIHREELKDI